MAVLLLRVRRLEPALFRVEKLASPNLTRSTMASASIRPLAASAVPVEAAATAIFRRFDKDNDGRLNRVRVGGLLAQEDVERGRHLA